MALNALKSNHLASLGLKGLMADGPCIDVVGGLLVSDNVVVVVACSQPVLPLQGAVPALSAVRRRLGLCVDRGRRRRLPKNGGRQQGWLRLTP